MIMMMEILFESGKESFDFLFIKNNQKIILDQHIKMKCVMYMQCIHLNQAKQQRENKKPVKHQLHHVGIMNSVH